MPIYRGTTQIQKVYLGNVELANVLQGITNLLVEPDRLVILASFRGGGQTLVASSFGRVFAWGNRGQGRLGDNFSSGNRTTPFETTSLYNFNAGETIVQLSLSSTTIGIGLTSQGRVFTFGSNSFGGIGDGTNINRLVPTYITGQFGLTAGETVIKIASGGNHATAVTSTGRVFVWGGNNAGQIGDGTTIDRNTPVNITSSFGLQSGETIVDISFGGAISGAVTSTGRVFMWGGNTNGILGDGTTIQRTTPFNITSRFTTLLPGEKVIKLSRGQSGHTAALTSTGRIYFWGQNTNGELGNGTTTIQTVPTLATGQYNLASGETISLVATGGNSTLVVTSTKRVFFHGNSRDGTAGDNTTLVTISTPRNTTARYALAQDETIIDMSLGLNHAGALTSKGKLFMWGGSFNGEVGTGKSGFISGTFTRQRELLPVVINISL
jgi:alpha-tubulin suppressor-like RCC1 family protein